MQAPCSTRNLTIGRLLQEAAQCNGVLRAGAHVSHTTAGAQPAATGSTLLTKRTRQPHHSRGSASSDGLNTSHQTHTSDTPQLGLSQQRRAQHFSPPHTSATPQQGLSQQRRAQHFSPNAHVRHTTAGAQPAATGSTLLTTAHVRHTTAGAKPAATGSTLLTKRTRQPHHSRGSASSDGLNTSHQTHTSATPQQGLSQQRRAQHFSPNAHVSHTTAGAQPAATGSTLLTKHTRQPHHSRGSASSDGLNTSHQTHTSATPQQGLSQQRRAQHFSPNTHVSHTTAGAQPAATGSTLLTKRTRQPHHSRGSASSDGLNTSHQTHTSATPQQGLSQQRRAQHFSPNAHVRHTTAGAQPAATGSTLLTKHTRQPHHSRGSASSDGLNTSHQTHTSATPQLGLSQQRRAQHFSPNTHVRHTTAGAQPAATGSTLLTKHTRQPHHSWGSASSDGLNTSHQTHTSDTPQQGLSQQRRDQHFSPNAHVSHTTAGAQPAATGSTLLTKHTRQTHHSWGSASSDGLNTSHQTHTSATPQQGLSQQRRAQHFSPNAHVRHTTAGAQPAATGSTLLTKRTRQPHHSRGSASSDGLNTSHQTHTSDTPQLGLSQQRRAQHFSPNAHVSHTTAGAQPAATGSTLLTKCTRQTHQHSTLLTLQLFEKVVNFFYF